MKIEEIAARKNISMENAGDVVEEMKGCRYIPQPDIEHAVKALDPKLHDINNPILRPDKKVKIDVDDEDNGESAQKVIEVDGETTNTRTEKVARNAVALQKLIIKRAVSFCFGNPVDWQSTPANENQELVMKAFNKILKDAKVNSLNRKIARAIFSYKEAAELWFPVEVAEHTKYGFPCKYKLRCTILSPKNGDTLYPYFDESGDMIAFSRSFSRKDSKGIIFNYFETYTDEEHWLWTTTAKGMEVVEGYPKPVVIGKIPVIFGHQDEFETEDVDRLIDRLEKLLSNFSDTNDYHASPKIFVKGELKGFSKKGEAGAIIEGEGDADAKYLAWQNAPESVKLEIETLLKLIYTISQTPDISFDSVKGLGSISGIALKLLFMDAHLKVQDKKEIFDDYLPRRANVIKAYIGKFNTKLEADADNLEIEPEITPYMLVDELNELNYWLTANGNKPVLSQEESIEKAKLSNNPKVTMEKINDESARDNSFVIGEPQLDEE
ncbi:phage portal protein [Segatella copri]|nr:phage portal protein [Segatella copri]